MYGLWEQEEGVHPVPFPKAVPFMWPASVVDPLIEQAARTVPVGNERRALQLFNPGFGGRFATTPTLVGAVQILLPGESARAHRHTASAIRFIMRGSGAYTRVNGERLYMEEGDLVLTPNWTWHDHSNDTGDVVVWMDGLDVPLVQYLNAWFFELYPERMAPDLKQPGTSRKLHGHASLKPTWAPPPQSYSPLLVYSWKQTWEALSATRDQEGNPHDGIALEYVHPQTGGPVIPTMACWVQMIRRGERLTAHRHTSSAVYYVVKGQGTTIIDGQAFNWTRGDFLALPAWCLHEHANTGDEDAILFSIQDTPMLSGMGLLREEAMHDNGGHQEVSATFDIENHLAAAPA
jgi:gentisate 1,2-dioxygenase